MNLREPRPPRWGVIFPFRDDDLQQSGQPHSGAETEEPRIFPAGAGARRGGGVSGIVGHNAAMAMLEKIT